MTEQITDYYYLGPAKVLTMRGKYRHTFLRISAEGEETNQSANLKVNSDKTLPIIVESVRDLGYSVLALYTHAIPTRRPFKRRHQPLARSLLQLAQAHLLNYRPWRNYLHLLRTALT